MPYYIMCRDDRKPNEEKGKYVVSSRSFDNLKDAVHYKDSISYSREPKILVEVELCVWCSGAGFIPSTGIMCHTCHGTGKSNLSLHEIPTMEKPK